MLLLAGAKILCGNGHDTVGIDIKRNLDLRDTSLCRRNTVELESAERLVVLCELTLALQDVDINGRLVIGSRGEDLALLGRNRGISLDQRCCNTSHRLDGKGQRRDIQKKDIAGTRIACELAALNSCTDSDALIRVDVLARLMAGQLTNLVLHARNTCGTTDQKDGAKIGVLQACIAHCVLHRDCGLVDKIGDQFLELCSRQVHVEVLRAVSRCRDERQVDLSRGGGGELLLRLLGCVLQALHGHLVGGKIDAFLLLELIDHPSDDAVIEVIAAKVCITVGCQNLDDAVADLDDGDIERAAAEIVDHDLLLFFVIQAIRQSCCRRLVDDTLDIKACDLACILGCLTLCIIEVCRNRDDGLGDLLAKVGLSVLLEL